MARAITYAMIGLVGLAGVKGVSLIGAASAVGSDAPPDKVTQVAAGADTAPQTVEPRALPERAARETPELLPELLVAIAAERRALGEREESLQAREAALDLARDAIAEQNRQLEALREQIDRHLARAERENTSDVTRLIEIYKAMKAEEAAGIMNEADIEVAVLVLAAMAPRSSGPIIAKMNPVRARAISKIILERSRLPGDQKLVDIRLN
ncbi:MotE family protein [Sulfitobacter aestuarii]|uniref:MotE family protein n=1 Tax=Sulfitobacter aestuarii TaxID=2161676 RepID=A0ABW5U3A6_9RHOB